MKKAFVIFALLLLPQLAWAQITDLGQWGNSYPVVEPDHLKLVLERAAKVDLTKTQEETRKMLEDYRPTDGVQIPVASQSRIVRPDLSWELPFEIKDEKTGLFYPKGFRFDPVPYIPMFFTYVVIDADRDDQLKWVEAWLASQPDRPVKLMVTQGSAFKLQEKLQRPVTYYTKPLQDRLKIQGLPAIYFKEEDHLVLQEFVVGGGKNEQ